MTRHDVLNRTRVALYYAPQPEDPLWHLGNSWLGRDPETGAELPRPAPGIAADITASPRHYGLHATLRPPIHLVGAWAEFEACACHIAATTAGFPLPPLHFATIDGFLALVVSHEPAALRQLADCCVRLTDALRAPPSAGELARRHALGLTPRQEQLLAAWGYPYVMQEWRFHMTLTRRLTASEMSATLPAACRHFGNVLAHPREIRSIAIFTEHAGSPMRLARRLPLPSADGS